MNIKLGASEQAIVSEIIAGGPQTVGVLTDRFRTRRGWARSTVQRMLDRLIAKKILERELVDGIFRYRAAFTQSDMEAGVVDGFVRAHLGGSVQPLVAYIHGHAELTDEDIAQLRAVVEDLERKREHP
jgi:predicted transcriptional regulator